FIAWRTEPAAKRLRWTAWLLLGFGMIVSPIAFRNRIVGGEFHLTTAQFGPNFYIGNNAASIGLYRPLVPGHESSRYEQQDAIDLAEKAMGRKLTPGEVSSYWTHAALADIRKDPLHWLRLLTVKSMFLVNVVEIGDTDDQYTYGDWSFMLRNLTRFLNFGTVV